MNVRSVKQLMLVNAMLFLADVLTARADEKYFKKSVWIPHTIPMHLGGRKVVYFEDEKIS